MLPYRYLGSEPRDYSQYIDDATGHPLRAEPGGAYSMTPVQGIHVPPVPPSDGMWAPEDPPPDTPAPASKTKTSKAAQPAAEGD